MTIPLWVFLGFGAWTLAVLLFGIGVSRWTLILTGRAELVDFPADVPHGSARYRRSMRAHANCVENLPLYGVLVAAIVVTGADDRFLDALAVTFLAARVLQTLVHVVPEETNRAVATRFAFFFVQIVCMIAMGTRLLVAWA